VLARALSGTVFGLDGVRVEVEANIADGLPGFHIVGLGDRSLQEARERVKIAINNSGFEFPGRRVTINLAPAQLPKEGSGFDLAMAAAIDDDTRLVFLGNPNNPTGTIYRKAQWHRFLKRVPERVVIVADEAYFEFVRDPEYPDSILDHDGRQMLVTLRTFSKIFGLAGLRVGYSVAREDITRLLNNVRQPFNITSLGLVAVEAGMDDHEHVRRTLEVNAEGMAYLEGGFRRLGLPFVPSQANFILVEVGEGRTVYEKLLQQGIIVRPMNGYGLPRHVRVSIGLEQENRRMMAALESVLRR